MVGKDDLDELIKKDMDELYIRLICSIFDRHVEDATNSLNNYENSECFSAEKTSANMEGTINKNFKEDFKMARIIELRDEHFRMFAEMAKKCEPGTELFEMVTLYYDGTNSRGNIRIEVAPGHASEANEILKELLGY